MYGTDPSVDIALEPPVLVGRRHGYYWFPTLMRLGDGALLVAAYDDLDAYDGNPMGLYSWSEDEGRSWSPSPPVRAPFSECGAALPNGDHLLLPYRLYPRPDGSIGAPASLVACGQRALTDTPRDVVVRGWPRPTQHQGDAAAGEVVTGGFSFNGQVIAVDNGGALLTTLYGHFAGDERYSLVTAVSPDGLDWSIRSIVAGPDCALPGREGPCEAALTRLADGRLFCVFRMNGGIENVYDPASRCFAVPYGCAYSSDEGRTWSEPTSVGDSGVGTPGSVQPSLMTLPDGAIALSGGRPGLYLWLCQDGVGDHWETIDLRAHHNAHQPDEPIAALTHTSSYTEIVALDESRLLCVYDRIPRGWSPLPADTFETNSIWAIQIYLKGTRA